MPYKYVEEPIKSPDAFKDATDEHVLSQAAVLLLLGAQMETVLPAVRPQTLRALRQIQRRIPTEYLKRLNIPPLKPQSGRRIQSQEVLTRLRRFSDMFVQEHEEVPQDVLLGLAKNLHQQKSTLPVASLLEACLRHSHEVVRVAAALAYFGVSSEPARLLGVIEGGLSSGEPIVRDLARAGLARLFPDHPRLIESTQGSPKPALGTSDHTTILVHGTLARDQTWWRPGGDFYNYLQNEHVRPDLFTGPDPFDWSGAYHDAARAIAARDLRNWLGGHNIQQPYVITHSHGGSVAMLATQNGLDLGPLVLLSCPVHFPKYMPDFNRVKRVVSVRVKFDWVIWLDGGGQTFQHPRIRENVLPIWFTHSATHDPEVWRTHSIPSLIPDSVVVV